MTELTLQKRRSGAISGAERITGVKNAQADMLLSRRKHQFGTQFKKTELDIQLEEYRLENEAKLLNLENKRIDLEYKKRLYPEADLSHEEMTIQNLEKYLVKSVNKLCYTDKALGTKVRSHTSPDAVSPTVEIARQTLVKKEILKAIEKNRKHMYNFLDKPMSRQDKIRAHQQKEMDEGIDEFERELMREKEVPKHGEMKEQKKENKPQFGNFLTIPGAEMKTVEPRQVENRVPPIDDPDKKGIDTSQSISLSTTGPLSRLSKKKPLTKTAMKDELKQVKCKVDDFCKKMEEVVWAFKEEEFQQGLKFVKNKDHEWNKFMETMQKRNRTESDEEGFVRPPITQRSRPQTAVPIPQIPLAESERQKKLMNNLLLTKPRTESAPVRRRGFPVYTAERIKHHSPTQKLMRLIERNKRVLEGVKPGEKPDPTTAQLNIANKIAEQTAK